MSETLTKEQWTRKYSYLPHKFGGCREQTWEKVKANALSMLRKNFKGARFRVYKCGSSMEVMFDGPQSKEAVYAELGLFATKHHCSAGYDYEFWHEWNFRFGGVKYVFITKRGEDMTYCEPKRKKTKKAKKTR